MTYGACKEKYNTWHNKCRKIRHCSPARVFRDLCSQNGSKLRAFASWASFFLDSKSLSLLYGGRMNPKSETQILWQAQAREVLLHGGTLDSFVRPYHPNLHFAAFRAYIGAVRDAIFRP